MFCRQPIALYSVGESSSYDTRSLFATPKHGKFSNAGSVPRPRQLDLLREASNARQRCLGRFQERVGFADQPATSFDIPAQQARLGQGGQTSSGAAKPLKEIFQQQERQQSKRSGAQLAEIRFPTIVKPTARPVERTASPAPSAPAQPRTQTEESRVDWQRPTRARRSTSPHEPARRRAQLNVNIDESKNQVREFYRDAEPAHVGRTESFCDPSMLLSTSPVPAPPPPSTTATDEPRFTVVPPRSRSPALPVIEPRPASGGDFHHTTYDISALTLHQLALPRPIPPPPTSSTTDKNDGLQLSFSTPIPTICSQPHIERVPSRTSSTDHAPQPRRGRGRPRKPGNFNMALATRHSNRRSTDGDSNDGLRSTTPVSACTVAESDAISGALGKTTCSTCSDQSATMAPTEVIVPPTIEQLSVSLEKSTCSSSDASAHSPQPTSHRKRSAKEMASEPENSVAAAVDGLADSASASAGASDSLPKAKKRPRKSLIEGVAAEKKKRKASYFSIISGDTRRVLLQQAKLGHLNESNATDPLQLATVKVLKRAQFASVDDWSNVSAKDKLWRHVTQQINTLRKSLSKSSSPPSASACAAP